MAPEDGFERPVPPPRARADGRGGVARWVVGFVAFGIFGASLWYAYERGSMDAFGTDQPPLIKADPRPTKLRPDDPGGLQVPNRDKLVYERLVNSAPDKRVERLLPPPEEPLARPAASAPAPAGEIAVGSTEVVAPAPIEAQKPPPQRAETLTLKLDPATQQPLQPPTAQPQPSAPTAVATVEPKPAPTVETPAPQAARLGPTQYGLQLAALRNADGVDKEWLRLQAAFGSVLGKLEHRVVKADLGERGTFYRVVAAAFADEAAARAACDKLQALRQDCFVVKLD
jgi:cell division septation protein DedD